MPAFANHGDGEVRKIHLPTTKRCALRGTNAGTVKQCEQRAVELPNDGVGLRPGREPSPELLGAIQ